MYSVTFAVVAFLAFIQAVFGAFEVFAPDITLYRVLQDRYRNPRDPIWFETEAIVRNLGLYNWFLAAGLILCLAGNLGGLPSSWFFSLCVAVAGVFALATVGYSTAFILQLVVGLAAVVLALCLPRT